MLTDEIMKLILWEVQNFLVFGGTGKLSGENSLLLPITNPQTLCHDQEPYHR